MPTMSTDCVLDSRSFELISDLAYRESGLQLVAEKTSMIQSRLRHRLRALGFNDFSVYCQFVGSDEGRDERRHMISALTTNVSHFFRENHHFDILAKTILPSLREKLNQGKRVRIWSAGCSNGQEACTIAMTILEHAPELAQTDLKILATDIDPKVIEFATAGVYPERLLSGIPKPLLEKYFDKGNNTAEGSVTVKPSLSKMISFRELNLLANWPMKYQMDVIFCRNVVIYFDLETQNKLWPRFHEMLVPGGYLFLGHSERIVDHETRGFVSNGPTTYCRSTTGQFGNHQ